MFEVEFITLEVEVWVCRILRMFVHVVQFYVIHYRIQSLCVVYRGLDYFRERRVFVVE